MGKVRRRFTGEFKEAVVQQALSGTSIKEICQEHQLHHQTVTGWLSKYEEGKSLHKSSSKEKVQARQIEKLQAKVGELTMTIDLLKKLDESLRQKKKEDGSVITAKNLAQFQKHAKL